MNILVADDEAVHIQLMTTRLRANGFSVVVARDAMQVLMAAARCKPAAILLDINLPGGTGLQALKRLKANVNTNSIPVVVVSGNDDPSLPDAVKQLGAEDFLHKPFEFEDVLRILMRVAGNPSEPLQ